MKLKEELWLPVIGFVGVYEVSNLGRVKSLSRVVTRGDSVMHLKETLLKPGLSGYRGGQYWMVVLRHEGTVRTARVHRLVCESFLAQPKGYVYVNHKDGDKLNNHINNLEWCTSSQNQAHAYRTGLRAKNIGVRNGRSKLSEETVRQIKHLLSKGVTQASIARQLGVSKIRVNSIKSGRTWGHI